MQRHHLQDGQPRASATRSNGTEPVRGVEWFIPPFWILLPIIVAAHVAGRTLQPSGETPKHAHRASHSYVLRLMPRGAMAGAFVVTAWLVVLYLFVPLRRSPFIYFQF